MIYVLNNEGSPSLTKIASRNTVESAKVFLSNYQAYSENPLFGELISTLEKVDLHQNTTKISGNIALHANENNGYTTFKCHYMYNGADATYSKFIALVFKDGFLSGFVDNWQLSAVGSTNINLSKEAAIDIALTAAKSHVSVLEKFSSKQR